MTEVNISRIDGRWKVIIGGVDLTSAITANGLRVELPSEPDYPLVHVTFRAKELNINLDDAVVQAVEQLLAVEA